MSQNEFRWLSSSGCGWRATLSMTFRGSIDHFPQRNQRMNGSTIFCAGDVASSALVFSINLILSRAERSAANPVDHIR